MIKLLCEHRGYKAWRRRSRHVALAEFSSRRQFLAWSSAESILPVPRQEPRLETSLHTAPLHEAR
jgi:hypothetical protein